MTTRAADDELARLRAAFTGAAGPCPQAPEPDSCPAPDRIWLGVRGELPPDELRSLLDHVATCQACVEDWRIAKEFEDESAAGESPGPGETPREEPRRAERSRWSRFPTRIAAAAAILLASAFGFQVYQQSQAPQTTRTAAYRTTAQVTIESALEAGSSLPRDRFVVSWRSTGSVASYSFSASVATGMEAPFFRADDLTSSQVRIPAHDLAGLRSGEKVMCLIKAYSADGVELKARTFTVAVQ